jgi:predicted acyl esterase
MTFGIVIAKDVMLPMRDRVRLAADIYRPATDGDPVPGQFPTILTRTSYDKSAQRYVDSIPNYFTPRLCGRSPGPAGTLSLRRL